METVVLEAEHVITYTVEVESLRARLKEATDLLALAVDCIDTRTHDGIFWGARASIKARIRAFLKPRRAGEKQR